MSLDWVRRLRHAAVVALDSYADAPPVLVYQMGKVGSSTVVATLRAAEIDHPVRYVHFMSARGLLDELRDYRRAGQLWSQRAAHAYTGLGLAARFRLHAPERCLVVTGVREPIGRAISSFFQTAGYRHPELCDGDVPAPDAALDFLHDHVRRGDRLVESTYRWLDRELAVSLGVDLYDHPFDRERGASIVASGDVRLLVYRAEDLAEQLPEALGELLGTDPVPLISRNVGTDKDYADSYRRVRRGLRLSEARLRSLYDHRFMAHFYGADRTGRLVERWSRPASQRPEGG